MSLNIEINQYKKQFMGFLDYQASNVKTKSIFFLVDACPLSLKFSIETSMEDTKSTLSEKNEFNYRN